MNTDEHHLSTSPQAAQSAHIKLAAMDFNMWCILASFLLVSAGANRYDRGPQKFYDVSFDSTTSEQNENKEVILFLTPDQVRALEAEGAVVRSSESSENEENETAEPQVNEDQSEEAERIENDETDQDQDAQQEQEKFEDIQNQDQDLDFEKILRLLNEEQVEEEDTEEASEELARNIPQVEEENTEKPRKFSPRFLLRQQQQKYLAPALAKKEQILNSYSSIRYQPNEQPQKTNAELKQQAEADDSSEEPQTESPTQERKKYKLVPYEFDEALVEPSEEENAETQQDSTKEVDDAQVTSDFNADRLVEVIGQRKNKLQQNELQLQSILRELKSSPKYNDQKYVIEIQRLKTNLEKQNALSKVEAIAKIAPSLIKQQFAKRRLLNKPAKQEKTSAVDSQAKTQLPIKNNVAPITVRPVSVPVLRAVRPETPRPISIPVETGRRLSAKNIKARTDKLFTVSRRTPESKKQSLEAPKSRPERITIVRHIWEN